MRQNKHKEEDFEDELEDQMQESLFKEADQMGIFQPNNIGGVDYGEALKKIETAIAKQSTDNNG